MINKSDNKKVKQNQLIFSINLNEKTACVIGNESNDDSIIIPRSIQYEDEEFIITSIGANSFRESEKIRSIQFPSDSEIQIIENNAFAGSSIEGILIPSHVTRICEGAFSWCDLEFFEISTDSELQVIEKDAFTGSTIEIFTIPSSITELAEGWCRKTIDIRKVNIFQNKNKQFISLYDDSLIIGKSNLSSDEFDVLLFVPHEITEIKIPPFIKRIGSYAFSDSSIENISIPSQITHIYEGAFFDCRVLEKIEIQEDSNLLSIGKSAFSETLINRIFIPSNLFELKDGWCDGTSKLTNVEIAKNNKNFIFVDNSILLGKTDLKSDSFDVLLFANRDIQNVTIPSNIKIIGSYSFSESNIESVSIPSLVTQICEGAFSWCDKLQTIEIPQNSKLEIIDKEAFEKCSFQFISFPSSLTKIGEECFYGCKVQNIEFPVNSELKIIEKNAFSHSSIQRISIPSHVTKICESTFGWCKDLQQIEFSEDSKLQIIEQKAFSHSLVEEITLPSSVFELKEEWCFGTERLNKIKIHKNKQQNIISYDNNLIIGKTDLNSNDYDILLFVPRNLNTLTIPSFIKQIGSYAFSGSLIQSIIIPPQITNIYDGAFSRCSQLQQIEISPNSNLKKIGESAFSSTPIQNIFIPPNIEKIHQYTFSHCKQLKKVEIPTNSNLKTIKKNAFFHSSIETISIPSTVLKLKEGWRFYSLNLKNVTIMPNNPVFKNYDEKFVIEKSDITSDIYDIFVFAPHDIKEVNIPLNINRIDSYAFFGCLIDKVSIPSNVKEIGHGSFYLCQKLKRIDIQPNSELKKIGRYAFYGCQINSIFIPSHLSQINDESFQHLELIEFGNNLDFRIIINRINLSCVHAIIVVPAKL